MFHNSRGGKEINHNFSGSTGLVLNAGETGPGQKRTNRAETEDVGESRHGGQTEPGGHLQFEGTDKETYT